MWGLHGRNFGKLKSVLHMLPVCVFKPVVERQLNFDFVWTVCANDICQFLQGQVLCCTCYQMLGSIHAEAIYFNGRGGVQ